MGSKRAGTVRALTTAAAALVAVAGVAGAAAAQEEPGLCRLFDIDAFAAATGQQYEQPPFWDLAENCKYVATSNPEGLHYVALQLTSMVPFDRVRESADEAVDLEIGGHPAFAMAETVSVRDELRELVYVDLGSTTFIATLIAEEGSIPDQRSHVIALAETAVSDLGDVPAAATEPPSEAMAIAAPELPSVEGVSWRNEWVGGGADLADPASMEPLLERLETDLSSLVVLTANAESTDGERLGGYTAIRVDGVAPAELEDAVRGWFGGLLGVDAPDTVTIGGKDVARLDIGPDQSVLIYVSGDTAVLLDVGEPHVGRILEALP
jgi:hypothetical protein